MHDIDQTVDEQGAMAYVDSEGKPWHGLGRTIAKGASPAEVAEAARLAWPVVQKNVKFDGLKGEVVDKDHLVMFRGDTGAVLDITGKGYVPHQNLEVLEFFAEYLGSGEMYIDTAGALNGGRYIWVQAKMDKGFNLGGVDKVQGRILLMNPHIYGKGMIAKFVAERVVCWNTLMMALSEGGKSIKIWHTQEFNKQRRESIKRDMGIARERLDAFKDNATTLIKLRLTKEDAVKLIAPIFAGDADKPLEQQGKTVTRIIELWQGAGMGASLATAKDTGWGLLNAVTQYYDHEYGRSSDSRLTMAWLGQGDQNKRKTLQELLQAAR